MTCIIWPCWVFGILTFYQRVHHDVMQQVKKWKILSEGKEVIQQNACIRNMQRRGDFWTHTHQEFCETVQSAGFEIMESKITFRGVSDFVVAKKIR